MRIPSLPVLLFCLVFYGACQLLGSEPTASTHTLLEPEAAGAALSAQRFDRPLQRGGKLRAAPVFHSIYQQQALDTLHFPFLRAEALAALRDQIDVMDRARQKENHQVGDLYFNLDQLRETIDILISRQYTRPIDLHQLLDAYQIQGEDRRGNVLFTAYFTPVVRVKKKPDAAFRHPIYNRPRDWEGPLPTRAEIEAGALAGRGLEIAYARNKVDIYYMQLQGSGYVQYPDGTQVLLSYNGANRHPYRSIEKYLLSREEWDVPNVSITGVRQFLSRRPELLDSVLCHNPSYTFFKPRDVPPTGAGQVPLRDGLSVAVDKRYIPLGSCLLAAVPIYDNKSRRVTGHEFRILFAQDTGGRIRGPGHVDLYMGVGDERRAQAMSFKHYGQLWLLLPKANPRMYSQKLSR
jgi:membrane-bound lytic murein transglycosylase A